MSAEKRQRFVPSIALGCIVAAGGSVARADPVHPSYGRFEGDVTVAPGAGLAAEPRGPSFVGELRIRYLETAGLFVVYEDGTVFGSPAEPSRSLSFGTELRPLFLARVLQDLELRREWLDLVVDSLALDLGTVFAQPSGGSFASPPGLQVGLGVGVPLAPRASGPWVSVRAGVRWSDEARRQGGSGGRRSRDVRCDHAVYEKLFMTHLVDAWDRRPE